MKYLFLQMIQKSGFCFFYRDISDRQKKIKKESKANIYFKPAENLTIWSHIFGEECMEDIKKTNEHEVIIKIAEILGNRPSELQKAEEVFNKMKFIIANYIINHEYKSPGGINSDLLFWLDTKSNPENAERLNRFISKFLKH